MARIRYKGKTSILSYLLLMGLVVVIACLGFQYLDFSSNQEITLQLANPVFSPIKNDGSVDVKLEETPIATASNSPTKPAQVYPKWNGWFVAQVEEGKDNGRTVAVAIEPGLDIDPNKAAREMLETLNDPRGWAGKGHPVRMIKQPQNADLVIYISTPDTTDKYCYPLQTNGEVSCTPSLHKIYLNSERWITGVDHIPDLGQYRRYLVSHEFGHSVGYKHQTCPGPGKPAPVMLQQTYSLKGCVANEWITVA